MSNNDVEDTRALTDPDTVIEFQKGLKQIATSLVETRDGFTNIQKDLNDATGTELFSREWTKLKESYGSIDKDFRTRSTSVLTFLEKLETGIFPSAAKVAKDPTDKSSKEESSDEIEFLLEDSEKLGKTTNRLVNDFNDFKKKLDDFNKTFEGFYNRTQKKNDRKIQTQSERIANLEKERDEVLAKIKEKSLEALAEGRYDWIWRLPGINSIVIIIRLIRDETVKQAIRDLKARYDSLTEDILFEKKKFREVQSDSDILDTLFIKLTLQSDARISDIAGGVNIFNDIWQAADKDLKALNVFVQDTASRVPVTLAVYEQTRHSVYNGIKNALKGFSLA